MSENVQVLVEKARQGDFEAFGELVHMYSKFVYSISIKMVRDFHLAEDLSQEVFVKAWRYLKDLREPSTFSSWLTTLTRHHCLDYIRKRDRLKEEMAEPNTLEKLTAASFMNSHTNGHEALWEALETLDENARLVIILFFLTGYRVKEISQLLQITTRAVESRIRRAKEKLKEELFKEMANTFNENRLEETFEEDVMWRIVPRIATIEIPVKNVKDSVEWYHKFIGTKAVFEDAHSAMLHLQGGNRVGVPTLYLVQTEERRPLHFTNTLTGIKHSIIDFYIPDLSRFHQFLKTNGVTVTDLNFIPGMDGYGGFGFEDLDGNLLSATNVTHSGQA